MPLVVVLAVAMYWLACRQLGYGRVDDICTKFAFIALVLSIISYILEIVGSLIGQE